MEGIMKAIYRPKDLLCVVVETLGDSLILEPIDGTEDDRFTVRWEDEGLMVDPTDIDIEELQAKGYGI